MFRSPPKNCLGQHAPSMETWEKGKGGNPLVTVEFDPSAESSIKKNCLATHSKSRPMHHDISTNLPIIIIQDGSL